MPKHSVDEHFLRECAAAAWAGELGLAPVVLGGLCDEGMLVTSYLENTHASWHEGGLEPKRSATLNVLAQLHAATTPSNLVVVDIDAAKRRYEQSEARALAHGADPTRVARLSRAMALIFEEAQSTPYTAVACHGDPHPENVVMHGDRAYLIDWAYAHRGDPMTDLAYFASHIGLSASDMHTLVADYGDSDPAHARRAAIYLTFMHASHYLGSHLGAPWFTPETQQETIAWLWQALASDLASLYDVTL